MANISDSTVNPIFLSDSEREWLLQALNQQITGLDDAKQCTVEDHTIGSANVLLDVIADTDLQIRTLIGIREKVRI